jgi:hypothetical protein
MLEVYKLLRMCDAVITTDTCCMCICIHSALIVTIDIYIKNTFLCTAYHVHTLRTASSGRSGEPESPVQPTSNPKDSPYASNTSNLSFKQETAGSLPASSLNLMNSVNAAPTAYQMSRLSDDDATTTNDDGTTADTTKTNVDSEEIPSSSRPAPLQKTSSTSHRGSFSLGSSNRKSISNGTATTSGLTIGPVALLREVM